MAYAESMSRPRTRAHEPRAAHDRVRSTPPVAPSDLTAPRGTSYQRDRRRAGTLGGVLALGVLLGAGVALLVTPRTGEEMRAELADGTRRLRGRAGDAWDDLRDELNWAARRGRKRIRRTMTRGGWAAEDTLDRARRRVGR